VLNYVAAPDLPAVVRVDERRLRQVLLNLLANAVQFTDHGEVTLSVSRGAAGRLRFEVRDTGIGVSADRLEAIFQPFEQAGDHAARRRRGPGSRDQPATRAHDGRRDRSHEFGRRGQRVRF
jgi:signal transduction histidine kinase